MDNNNNFNIILELRKYRIHDIALFDLISAVIGTEIIFRYFNMPQYLGAVSSIPLGIIVHKLFNIDTELNYKLGISNKPYNNQNKQNE